MKPKCQLCCIRRARRQIRFPGSNEPTFLLCERCNAEMCGRLERSGLRVLDGETPSPLLRFLEAYHEGLPAPSWRQFEAEPDPHLAAIDARARLIVKSSLQQGSDVISLWDVPEAEHRKWQQFTGFADSLDDLRLLTRRTQEIAAEAGVLVVLLPLTVAEMQAKLAQLGLENTSQNRAFAVTLFGFERLTDSELAE